MAGEDRGEQSMSKDMEFWFNWGGKWSKKDDGTWTHVGCDMDLVIAEVSSMTYEQVVKHYSELGFPTPKGIYIHDCDKGFEDGMYVISNEQTFRTIVEYADILDWKYVQLFVDDENMSMPPLTPNFLTLECMNRELGIEDVIVEEEHIQNEEMNLTGPVDNDMNLSVEDLNFEVFDQGFQGVTMETEINLGGLDQGSYVNPIGYISENEEDDTFECEDDNSETDSDFEEDSDCADDVDLDLDQSQPYEEPPKGCFSLGQTFANAAEARLAINDYGVKYGYKLHFEKNEKTRLRVYCKNAAECPFKLLISKDGGRGGLAVKTANMVHRCFPQVEVPSASANLIARYCKSSVYKNPKIRARDMQAEIEKHLHTRVSVHKCKRAKRMLIHELEGSFKQEFSVLAAYAEKVKESNPGSKCEIELSKDELENGKRVFRRMFVLLDACKKNWLGGCRPLISLDGCFLKSVCKGMLLTAVGIDGNDQVVPIAWAVVRKENKVNWNWFLCWLRQELKLDDGSKFTVISDMQKGLTHAVRNILPNAEHRWCARHIWSNWSKKWRGNEMQKRFWICAWSTFKEDFEIALAKLGEIHRDAAKSLLHYPKEAWCRAFQSDRCSCFMVDNNISESFNSAILDARQRPIMSMLEGIRIKCMGWIRDRKNNCDSWFNEWSPAAMKMFEENKVAAVGCKVIWNGDEGYEIGEGEDKHTVMLKQQICTCRSWQLTGIPCMHAISAMYYSKIEPITRISSWYHNTTYEKAYGHTISPVPGVKFFKVEAHAPIEPPPPEKSIGRPRKKRIRASNEPRCGTKLSRKEAEQKCTICKTKGHNQRSCPTKENQASNSTAHTNQRNNVISKRHYKKSKPTSGLGCYVDLDSGKITFNPGQSSEYVVKEGQKSIPHDSDPVVRGAIPNEKEIRHEKRKFRHINFSGEGPEVIQPGLKWKGASSITTRQLLEQQRQKKLRIEAANRGK